MAEIGKDTEFDSKTPFKCSSKNEAKEKVILEDYFSCYTKFNKVTYFVVKLTNLALVCEPLTNDPKPKIQRVSTNDIVGCSVKKTNPKSDTEQTFQIHLEIYYYPMIRRFWIKQRSRRQLSLIVDRSISWEINENRATKWKNALLWTSSKLEQPKDGLHYEQTLGRPLELLPKRHLLVAINPVSGQKKAYEIFTKRVVPLLEESEITWEVVLSEKSKFMSEYIQSADLSKFDGIISISGDGLLFEIVNGLLIRPDWNKAIHIPIGVVPGGSGNALATSLCEAQSESIGTDTITPSVLNIISRRTQPKNLILLQTLDDAICSLSSVEWGLLADIIIDAEFLRCFGEIRYGITGAFKSLGPKKYRCRLSFVRATNENRTKMARARESIIEFPDSQHPYFLYKNDNYKSVTACHEDAHLQSRNFMSLDHGSSNSSWKERTSFLPRWDQAVPEDWETIEGKFYMIGCSFVSRVSTYTSLAPDAKFDDDTIWLTLLQGHVPRVCVPYLLIAMRQGKHVNSSFVDTVPVLAFRLEPFDSGSDFAVDGDYIKCQPLQGEILPFTINVMSR